MAPQTRRFGTLNLSDASAAKALSAPSAAVPAAESGRVAPSVGFRPGTLAKAARRSPPSAARRAGGSLGPFRSTAWIATPASPGQGWRSLRRWAASVPARPLCRECNGTGWIPYRSETIDGELEEAYRLCPNHCTPRRCTDLTIGHPCPPPATVRYGLRYYCKEHTE